MAGERDPRQVELASETETEMLCSQIRHAAKLVETARIIGGLAAETASSVSMQTTLVPGNFLFKVILPEEDNDSYIVKDDGIIASDPKEFVATELRGIGEHGAEFYNSSNDQWLKTKNYDFDVVPLIPQID